MWASRWSPAISIRPPRSRNTVSEGLCPGRCRTCSVRSSNSSSSPSRNGSRHPAARAEGAERCADGAERGRQVTGHPVAAHDAHRELVIRVALALKLRQVGASRSSAATSAPERRARISSKPEVVHVLMGDDDQLEVLDRVPETVERLLELVERLARVGPGVDERQRPVLDQVAVDAPDQKRGRQRDGDGSRPGRRRRAPSARRRPSASRHERITPSSSSRWDSMSSRERSDSTHSRSSGSVLDGRALKCQSS